ncbi:MAG: AmmeMemoRadiSam system protein B [Deltaproteobacteria bacterium]|nr:AmmeMemoRadiSam system protein B [Deltaproteobacteria bacterium]
MKTRAPRQAGRFYPGDREGCKSAILEMLSGQEQEGYAKEPPVAGIAPHAGWFFSGKLALKVMMNIKEVKPETIVILAAHTSHSWPAEVTAYDFWDTPIGKVEVDKEFVSVLVDLGFSPGDQHHDVDHSVEVHLPFMKTLLPDARLVAVALASNDEAAGYGRLFSKAAERTGRKITVIGSTDLTHYGLSYGLAPKGIGSEALEWVKKENDKRMVDLIEALDCEAIVPEAIKRRNSCGAGAVAAALAHAREMGRTRAEILDYTTSYDIYPKGGPDSFVGYVAAIA